MATSCAARCASEAKCQVWDVGPDLRCTTKTNAGATFKCARWSGRFGAGGGFSLVCTEYAVVHPGFPRYEARRGHVGAEQGCTETLVFPTTTTATTTTATATTTTDTSTTTTTGTPLSTSTPTGTSATRPRPCSWITGVDGRGGDLTRRYHGGAVLRRLHRRAAPPGTGVVGWPWWACARECAEEPRCRYWFVPARSRMCILRRGKSAELAAPSFAADREGIGHGDQDASCAGIAAPPVAFAFERAPGGSGVAAEVAAVPLPRVGDAVFANTSGGDAAAAPAYAFQDLGGFAAMRGVRYVRRAAANPERRLDAVLSFTSTVPITVYADFHHQPAGILHAAPWLAR